MYSRIPGLSFTAIAVISFPGSPRSLTLTACARFTNFNLVDLLMRFTVARISHDRLRGCPPAVAAEVLHATTARSREATRGSPRRLLRLELRGTEVAVLPPELLRRGQRLVDVEVPHF